MRSRACCSEQHGVLVVLEGMPGAGKTTAIGALARCGHQVVGEYLGKRPTVHEDDAHQANWIAKGSVAGAALVSGHVFSDRDFLTSLAFAWSVQDRELMTQRAEWALTHLAARRLMVGDVYLVLDLTPSASLERRASRLTLDHPWSRMVELERLRRFYLSPLDALMEIDGDLATAFARARWYSASGEDTTPDEVALSTMGLVEELGGRR